MENQETKSKMAIIASNLIAAQGKILDATIDLSDVEMDGRTRRHLHEDLRVIFSKLKTLTDTILDLSK